MKRSSARVVLAVLAAGVAVAVGLVASSGSSAPPRRTPRVVQPEARFVASMGEVARHALRDFRVPTGGVPVARPPAGTSPDALVPIPPGHGAYGSPYLVDLHRFYVVPGVAREVVRAILAHPAAGWGGFILDGRCDAVAVGHRCLAVLSHGTPNGASAAVVPDVQEVEQVKVITIQGDRSVVRVDAVVSWWGPKTPQDVVPPGAKVLVVAQGWQGMTSRVVRTITDPAVIEAFRERVNSLQVLSPTQACTANLVGPPYEFRFQASARAAPFARVAVDLSGCVTVDVEVHGHPGAELLGGAVIGGHLP